jgi:Pyruvate/2-oxoacid:ferredoxin oxidoreductase delta subunit
VKRQRGRPWIQESTRELFRLHGWRGIGHFLHGYYYLAHLDRYIKILLPALRAATKRIPAGSLAALRPIVAYVPDRYHGKVTTLDDARKIIMLEQDIALDEKTSSRVVPYEIANRMVVRNPGSITLMDCACKLEKRNPACGPLDVCLIVGEPYATFALEHAASLHPRRVTREEAVRVLEMCHKKGWVQNAIFKDAMGGQFFAICNCCKCCCGGLEVERALRSLPLENPIRLEAPSGYLAVVDPEKCESCGACAARCPMSAISLEGDGPAVVRADYCMGCGVCPDICSKDAISLKRDPSRGIPLDVHELLREGASAW